MGDGCREEKLGEGRRVDRYVSRSYGRQANAGREIDGYGFDPVTDHELSIAPGTGISI